MNVVSDQVVDTETAQALTTDVCRDHGLVGWVVVRDQPSPGAFTARLAAGAPTTYVVQAETLADLQAALPAGLERSERQPNDPPDLVEVWFAR
jgi:hypothetical protein